MGNKSPKVDAYIKKSPEFSRPILEKVRALFHKASPDVEESIKWGVPHFEYKGILGGTAAFKEHVRFGFWKSGLMNDPYGVIDGTGNGPMSGFKLTSAKDLPPDKVMIAFIKKAVRLNEEDIKPQAKKKTTPQKLEMPAELTAALKKNKKAAAVFEEFSPSNKREYAEWIADAKQEATRDKRIATAIEWIAEGKPRNWKYMKEWR